MYHVKVYNKEGTLVEVRDFVYGQGVEIIYWLNDNAFNDKNYRVEITFSDNDN